MSSHLTVLKWKCCDINFQVRKDEAEVLYFHAKLQDAGDLPTRKIMERFRVCMGLQNKNAHVL